MKSVESAPAVTREEAPTAVLAYLLISILLDFYYLCLVGDALPESGHSIASRYLALYSRWMNSAIGFALSGALLFFALRGLGSRMRHQWLRASANHGALEAQWRWTLAAFNLGVLLLSFYAVVLG